MSISGGSQKNVRVNQIQPNSNRHLPIIFLLTGLICVLRLRAQDDRVLTTDPSTGSRTSIPTKSHSRHRLSRPLGPRPIQFFELRSQSDRSLRQRLFSANLPKVFRQAPIVLRSWEIVFSVLRRSLRKSWRNRAARWLQDYSSPAKSSVPT